MDEVQEQEGGLCIKLSTDTPTLIKIGDQTVKVYLLKLENGQQRARFVADRSIRIVGPHRYREEVGANE